MLVAFVALLPLASAAEAQRPGDEYEITKSYETSGKTSDGSSSSSNGSDALLERLIGAREGGWEYEYDLPKDASAEERARSWQFPARVLKRAKGPMQLLNAPELETRLDAWLKKADWTRAVCGRWIFTWNAFKIECDPRSVLEMVEAIDLTRIDAREGAIYRDPNARAPANLKRRSSDSDGPTLVAVLNVDPEAVRRARAESDVVVGEISGKPVTLEAALKERAKEKTTGTISVTLASGPDGRVHRRTKVTRLKTEGGERGTETNVNTETVERRRLSLR